MLFDKPNIELLKLIAVCKDFPTVTRFPNVYLLSAANIGGLTEAGLLTLSQDCRRIRTTKLGYDLLNSIGFPCQPDAVREANEQTLIRREQSAQVMFMLMLAGVDVFTDSLLEPDHRERLIESIFPVKGFAPPDPAFKGCDGMWKGEPIILGVDMDLRRMMTVIGKSHKTGKTAHIFSRPCQCEVLNDIVPTDGVLLYKVKDDVILDTFSFSSLIEEPPIEPYVTDGGNYIGDADLQVCRDMRKTRK